MNKSNALYYITVNCTTSNGKGLVGDFGTATHDRNWSGTQTITPSLYNPALSAGQVIEVYNVDGYDIGSVTGRNISNLSGPTTYGKGKYWRFKVTGNATLNVTYIIRPVTYTVTTNVTPSGGGTLTGGGTYRKGESTTLRATANDNYKFDYLDIDGTRYYTSEKTITVNSNITATAHFIQKPVYQLVTNVSPSGCGTITPGGTFYEGTRLTVSFSVATGYRFQYLLVNGVTQISSTSYSFNIYEYTTILAVCTPIPTYQLVTNVSPSGCGTITPGGTFYEGTRLTVSFTMAPLGYIFQYLLVNGVTQISSTSYSFNIYEYTTILAVCTPIPTYQLVTSISPQGAGSVSGGGTYNEGTRVSLNAVANDGYFFHHWLINGVTQITANPYQFNIYQYTNAIALFIRQLFYFTVFCQTTSESNWNLGEGELIIEGHREYSALFFGDRTITERVFPYNTNVQCRITVFETRGAEATNIVALGNVTDIQGPYEEEHSKYWLFKVNGTQPAIRVVYEEQPKYPVQVQIDPVGSGIIYQKYHKDFDYVETYIGYYYENDIVDLKALPSNDSYIFKYWTGEGGETNPERTYKIMPGTNQLYAFFRFRQHITISVETILPEGYGEETSFELKVGDTIIQPISFNTWSLAEGTEFTITPTFEGDLFFDYWKETNELGQSFYNYNLILKGTAKQRVDDHEKPWYQNYQFTMNAERKNISVQVKAIPGEEIGKKLNITIIPVEGSTIHETLVDTNKTYSLKQGDYILIEADTLEGSILNFNDYANSTIPNNASVEAEHAGIFTNIYLTRSGIITANYRLGCKFEAFTNPSIAGTISVKAPAYHLSGNEYTIPQGATLELNVTPRSGFRFQYWILDGRYISRDTRLVIEDYDMTKYTSFEARFVGAADTYIVTTSVLPLHTGYTEGDGEYRPNEQCTLKAFPNAGYEFDHWDTGETTNTLTFRVTADIHHTAYFKERQQPIPPPPTPTIDLAMISSTIKRKRRRMSIIIK